MYAKSARTVFDKVRGGVAEITACFLAEGRERIKFSRRVERGEHFEVSYYLEVRVISQ